MPGLAGLAALMLTLGTAPASACSWWPCDSGWYGYRNGGRAYPYARPYARGHAYRGRAWRYGYRGWGWAYGYNPERAWGYAYAAWPSTSIPQTRWYLNTATQVPNADAVGLVTPITSADGLLQGGMPGRGPTLFGPNPPPSTWAYAYGYGPTWAWKPRRRR